MIKEIYVMQDRLTSFMDNLFTDYNEASAIRNFVYCVKNNPNMYANAKDYMLYKVGTFDLDTGKIVVEDNLKLLMRGDEIIE